MHFCSMHYLFQQKTDKIQRVFFGIKIKIQTTIVICLMFLLCVEQILWQFCNFKKMVIFFKFASILNWFKVLVLWKNMKFVCFLWKYITLKYTLEITKIFCLRAYFSIWYFRGKQPNFRIFSKNENFGSNLKFWWF